MRLRLNSGLVRLPVMCRVDWVDYIMILCIFYLNIIDGEFWTLFVVFI